jgi:hypothetical protein
MYITGSAVYNTVDGRQRFNERKVREREIYRGREKRLLTKIHTGSGSGVGAETSLKVGSGSGKNHFGSTTLLRRHNTENSKQIFPEMNRASESQFPHSCACAERFTYSEHRSAYSATGKYVDRSWEYMYKSLTDT